MKLVAILAVLAALAGPAAQAGPPNGLGGDSLGADWGGQQDIAREGVRSGRYLPLAEVISAIRRRTPGRQLDAGLESEGPRAVYRVRWAAADGRRIDYIVDAKTGVILRAEGR